MSFPASLSVIAVTGTILDGEGLPRSGRVIFRTPGYAMSGADDTFVVPRLLAAFLDASGHFSISLPATNDPQWTPVGWTYRVTMDFGDDGREFFGNVVVPYDAAGNTISLASLAPVPEANGQLYALYNDPRFSGVGGGGGGAVASVFGRTGVVTAQTGDYTKAQVGLGSVDNTSDVNKPVSTAQAAADSTVATNASNALTSGLAGKAATVHSHAEADVTGLTTDLGTLSTAITGKAATVHTHAETDVTSLVSDLALKAALASPTFTGTPTLPTGTIGVTQTAGNSTTALATTAFVTTADNLKAPLASPVFTGTPSLPTGTTGVTQTAADSTTKLATTAFVTTADNLKANIASPTFTGTVAGVTAAMVGAVPLATFTTKGDLLVVTAASTVTRLAVGSDGNVLTADAASAGGVKWAAPSGGSGTYSLPDGLDPPSGYFQAITPGRTSINLTMALGRTYFMPLPMGNTARTLTSLTVEIRTASGAGGLISCSLCSSTTGRLPNAEIANYGTKAADVTGNKTWASGASLAANTLYYAAACLTVATGAAVVAIDAFNPYVAANVAFTGTTAFGAYVMNSALPLGATTFTYFDVDACIRVVAVFA